MDMLPLILLILFPVLLIGIILVLRRLRSETAPPAPRSAVSTASAGTAPAALPHLETLRRAAEQMDTGHIENLLEMGATLKPGAEEIFRQELSRRKADEEPTWQE